MTAKRTPEGARSPGHGGSEQERSVIDLIGEIRSGNINPRNLAAIDRQACVAYLRAEGLSVPEIAQVLRCSDRTVTRDRKALQETAALEHDPQLAGRMAGQLLQEALVCMDRIRRVGRDRETPPNVKVDAERTCFEIFSGLIQRLQSLGYLPTAAQRLEASLTHSVGQIPSIESIQAEVARVKQLTESWEGTPPQALLELEDEVARAALASRVEQVSSTLTAAECP